VRRLYGSTPEDHVSLGRQLQALSQFVPDAAESLRARAASGLFAYRLRRFCERLASRAVRPLRRPAPRDSADRLHLLIHRRGRRSLLASLLAASSLLIVVSIWTIASARTPRDTSQADADFLRSLADARDAQRSLPSTPRPIRAAAPAPGPAPRR
jgi:hypothetical protein